MLKIRVSGEFLVFEIEYPDGVCERRRQTVYGPYAPGSKFCKLAGHDFTYKSKAGEEYTFEGVETVLVGRYNCVKVGDEMIFYYSRDRLAKLIFYNAQLFMFMGSTFSLSSCLNYDGYNMYRVDDVQLCDFRLFKGKHVDALSADKFSKCRFTMGERTIRLEISIHPSNVDCPTKLDT